MKKNYVIISTDEYKGIPVQKCKFENGNIMYRSCSTWFEDFEDFMESVDDSVEEDEEDEEPDLFQQMGLESERMDAALGRMLNIRRR